MNAKALKTLPKFFKNQFPVIRNQMSIGHSFFKAITLERANNLIEN